jgi:hypothetical protein
MVTVARGEAVTAPHVTQMSVPTLTDRRRFLVLAPTLCVSAASLSSCLLEAEPVMSGAVAAQARRPVSLMGLESLGRSPLS